MRFEAEGLVIREKYVGETDRLVTILTRQKGVLRAFARRIKPHEKRQAFRDTPFQLFPLHRF